ncbi:MAG: DUF4249 family protein [Bacteroidales bacterium]|nr:DUF4249 family protein [Bacteroidales bacterium]
MKHFIKRFYLYCLMLMTMSSCIDEYKLPSSDTEAMVVIFGQIVEESECIFTLRSTATPTGQLEIYSYIRNAKIQVRGTDGQVFEGKLKNEEKAQYEVSVGKLDPAQKYYVHVSTPYGDFESEPMQPLDAPGIVDLYYEQPRDDKKVDIMVSTQDPQGLCYLLWQVDEYWEIRTPYSSRWTYQVEPGEDPYDDKAKGHYVLLTSDQYTNHGWRHETNLTDFATNEDYANGAITKRCICQRDHLDHRFQNRCLVRVKQMAISKEEYEYRNLMLNQTSNVGDLFSQMPTELPTNIISLGQTKGIGYIGVRGRTSTMEMYINGSDVDYKSTDHPSTLPSDKVYASPNRMMLEGYSIFSHNPDTGETIWTFAWCVDYHDNYWNGTDAMERPDFWKDK